MRARTVRGWRRLGGAAAVVGAVALAALAATAAADRGQPSSTPATAGDEPATTAGSGFPFAAPPGPAPTALGRDIAAALGVEAERLAALEAQFEAATDEAAALAVQRGIERLKRETEIEILRLQARHARAAGLIEAAERIEAAARQLGEPPTVAEPAPRPAPQSHGEAGRPE